MREKDLRILSLTVSDYQGCESAVELTDTDRLRLEISAADSDIFEFKTRITDASITADYPSTIRPTDESPATTRMQQPSRRDIVEQQDSRYLPCLSEPRPSLSDSVPQSRCCSTVPIAGVECQQPSEHFVNANCLLGPLLLALLRERGRVCATSTTPWSLVSSGSFELTTTRRLLVPKRTSGTSGNVRDDRFEDIPHGAQILQLIMNLSTKRYSSGTAHLLLLGNHEWQTLEEAFRPQLQKKLLQTSS